MFLNYSLLKNRILILLLGTIFISFWGVAQEKRFNINIDLLLVHFDSKTDVDDIHTMAALATLLHHPDYSKLNYHTVAGAYGIQEGLYVPANEVFKLGFYNNWSDAHANKTKALKQVAKVATKVLRNNGAVWIADAGQSDFSAQLTAILLKRGFDNIHVVQHSDWNESVTSPHHLEFVKSITDYHKIADGNALGNGTPGFRSITPIDWERKITDKRLVLLWEMAIAIGNKYNGKEGRYLNEAIANGGLDFSDLSEVCYILNIEDIKDANAFFAYFEN